MSKKQMFSKKFEQDITGTVEMTEIDGIEEDAVLCFTDIGKFGMPASEKEVKTCYGDLYVIINVLRGSRASIPSMPVFLDVPSFARRFWHRSKALS
mgnify:CR=1 FL=1